MSKPKEPIQNNEEVLAITESGRGIPYRFGQLKSDYQSKKIKEKIVKVYVPRIKKNYYVAIRPTLGCKFVKMGETK